MESSPDLDSIARNPLSPEDADLAADVTKEQAEQAYWLEPKEAAKVAESHEAELAKKAADEAYKKALKTKPQTVAQFKTNQAKLLQTTEEDPEVVKIYNAYLDGYAEKFAKWKETCPEAAERWDREIAEKEASRKKKEQEAKAKKRAAPPKQLTAHDDLVKRQREAIKTLQDITAEFAKYQSSEPGRVEIANGAHEEAA